MYNLEVWNGVDLGEEMKISAVLNVAHDLRVLIGWPDVEYMHVGLVDGPGNAPAAYCAAVLALATLVARKHRVLVCCHTGGRSVAAAMMYLNVGVGRGWDDLLELLRERVDVRLPVPHAAHRAAFSRMNWRVLANMIRG